MKLLNYIQGNRKGKEAHRLEKESMRDPFLADALEGFDSVKGDHIKSIQDLRSQIHKKSTHAKRNLLWACGVAASLLVGIFIGTHYLLDKDGFQNENIVFEALPTFESEEEMMPIVREPKEDIITQNKEGEQESASGTVTPLPIPPAPVVPPVSEILIITEDDAEIQEIEFLTEEPYIIISEEEAVEPIIIKEIPAPDYDIETRDRVQEELATTSSENSIRVRGKVVDKDGEPLIGASVYVAGTQMGTVTNMDGDFELVTDKNAQISINYVGYESLSLMPDTFREMHIAMNESQETLYEVVVSGYGKNKKATQVESVFDREPIPVIGKKEYNKYLTDNLRKPSGDNCGNGKVKLSFKVDSQGRPYEIQVEKGLCHEADIEAIRLIEEGPDWTLGNKLVTIEVKF